MYKNKYLKYKHLYKKQLGGKLSTLQLGGIDVRDIYETIRNNDTEKMTKLLSDKSINFDIKPNLYSVAIKLNRPAIVKCILEVTDSRLNPANDDNAALTTAIQMKDRWEIVEFLLKDDRVKEKLNEDQLNKFMELAEEQYAINNKEPLKLLVKYTEVKPSKGGNHMLHYASKENDIELVKLILIHKNFNRNVDIIIQDSFSEKIKEYLRFAKDTSKTNTDIINYLRDN